MNQTTVIFQVIILGLLGLGFLLLGWRDVVLLFTRPTARLGTGIGRIWSVARVTLLEVRYHRVWLLLLLHVVAFGILMLAVRPFDESERIGLYIWMALLVQQLVVLVPFLVMACMSLPRERERKTIITNATKPLSRFELMLGKILGFSLASGAMLVAMGLVTWAMLAVANANLKHRALVEYQHAETDYRMQAQRPGETRLIPPPLDKKNLAEEGSLFAYNYVTPRPGNFSVVGKFDTSTSPPQRYMKGGSEETAIYRFPGRIALPFGWESQPLGKRPAFHFYFPAEPYMDPPPRQIQLQVSASRVNQPLQSQDKTLILSLNENRLFQATWEPDRPEELFGVLDPSKGDAPDMGPVEVRVSCGTPGVWLHIFDGGGTDASGQMAQGAQFNVYLYTGDTATTPPQQLNFLPLPNPVVEGFQRRGTQQISGPDYSELARGDQSTPLEIGVFKFSGEDLAHVPIDKEKGTFRLSLFLDVDKVKNGDIETQALVSVFNSATPSDVYKQTVTVVEKRRTDVEVPIQALGLTDPSKRGDMYVLLYCETSGHWIGARPTSARIESPPTYFVFNLMKSELTLWAEATLLIVLGVVCSIRLDWPLALLTSVTVAALGSIAEFVASLPAYGGLNALNWSPYANHGATWRFFDRLTYCVWEALNVLVHLVPNFARYDPNAFIMELRNRPWEMVGSDIWATAVYSVPLIVLGYLLMRKQELG